uniref:Uncharacterized protein n=1 Tax=Oncorhynchus mykiss TaxID=8022 RepID=A0A8K9V3A4_ONCMY
MNNCGKRFHSEAAKFRFLNELIKVLSPKFLGQWSGAEVKLRVTEVLYSWTLWLKEEPKIQEAYRMLKKQGLVKKDPKLPDTIVMPPPSQRAEDSVFNQEDKAKLLATLLKSSSPEDLQTANRLIKNTIKEEQQKAELVSRRVSTLEEVASRTRQLRELLQQHGLTGPSTHHTDHLKALYESCDRLRPNLFRLASDTVDDDEALAQILRANDELTLVVNMYKDMMGGRESNRMRGGGGGESTNRVCCLVFVPPPSKPITVYDQNGVHVSLHFAKDPPPGHPNVAVVIVSTVNTSALPVKDILFQAAVPKTMTVKLQPSSGNDLPSYNPLLPPAALSQILLLSNPHRHKVRLRYKLTLVHGDGEQSLSEMGEVEDFPDWVSWMGL